MASGQGFGGFSKQQMIQVANLRTEQRAKTLDQDSEFYTALQELCLERRWWWRRRIGTFQMTAGTSKYNLSSIQDQAGQALTDVQQIAKNGFKIYYPGNVVSGASQIPSPWNNVPYAKPEPVFDPDVQDEILALQNQYPPATPVRFFLIPGETMLLIVDPIPDQSYPCSLAYWAVPNYTSDDSDETVPLLPNWMQPALIKKLEMHFWAFKVNQGDTSKYEIAEAEYEKLIEKASLYTPFADGFVEEFKNKDWNDSIRSTGGGGFGGGGYL
jgi:hypothetical protein